MFLRNNAQVIGIQVTPYVGMIWLVICIDVEQQRGKDAAL